MVGYKNGRHNLTTSYMHAGGLMPCRQGGIISGRQNYGADSMCPGGGCNPTNDRPWQK